jgi:hypothetical protein
MFVPVTCTVCLPKDALAFPKATSVPSGAEQFLGLLAVGAMTGS